MLTPFYIIASVPVLTFFAFAAFIILEIIKENRQ